MVNGRKPSLTRAEDVQFRNTVRNEGEVGLILGTLFQPTAGEEELFCERRIDGWIGCAMLYHDIGIKPITKSDECLGNGLSLADQRSIVKSSMPVHP